MALDPKYLQSLPDSLVDMYGLVEIDILEDMARRISTYDFFIPSAQHQLQKLVELGGVKSDIINKLSALTGKTQDEIVALLTEAGEVAIADDIEYYKAADVYEPNEIDTEALYKNLNSGLIQTEQAFKNITATTANTATKQFENALDRAWTQINIGGMDYTTAITRAIKDMSNDGLGAIAYKSGRVDNIEVAVRRAVVTGANQTAAKTQEALADELDIDLVEVTAHGGARPEHAKWQGKCYSRNGRKTINGVTYEDLRKATGYGTGAGLCGWNCRHNMRPYVPGAPRTWTDKQLKKLDDKNIEYNGEKYTEYEASQIQRSIEREIRKQKRTVAALEAAGKDASAERSKLRAAQKTYTDFTKQTGLKKQQARTTIGTGTGTAKPAQDNGNKKVTIETAKKRDIIPIETKKFETGEKANEFFYYDGEERGLKARNNSAHGQWKKSLSKDETDSIFDYTGGGYYDINNYLRKVGDWESINADKVEYLTHNIDNAISRYTLKENITVQRGVMTDVIDILAEEYDIQNSLDELIGKKYVEKGYSSTTVLRDNNVATVKPVVFDIDIPAGTGRGAYVNQLAGQFQDTEYEFLIKRGASFTITEVKEEKYLGDYRYYVKLVLDDE